MQDKNIAAVFAAIDKLEECLNRYKTVQNPEYIIRIWHYIQYGSAILDYFDNSVAENALQVAGGRYVAKFGSYKEVKLVISKLEKYLIKLDKVPTTVYILPSRNSEILSKAISKILGVDCIQYIRNTPVQNGLIVAGDTSEFNDYPELVNIRGNTVTFALNHNWLDNSLITPDICGFMSQTYIFPWEGGSVKVNPETKQVDKSEPDLRSAEEIAHSIASEEVEINPEFNEILEFYYERKDYMKGGLKDTFKRLHYNTDSNSEPVVTFSYIIT